ncbi:hypothetical protein NGRA_0257 [Nosema granulosis]|uniref:Uncharacterized protein n=1 Tax=Nosema granulosis TaxID=83296 RepID=A0A9P6H0N8_9MICR|nr:hypothetical protein NGRA_0257 [Nosema granulosis]
MKENLSFNYPLADKTVYDLEKRIKTYMRRYSINIPKEKDIERYSDTYNDSILVDLESTKKHIIPDVLSPELLASLGLGHKEDDDLTDLNASFNLDLENVEDSLEEEISSEVDGDYKIGIDDKDESTSNEEEEMVI